MCAYIYETTKPIKNHKIEMPPEQNETLLNFLKKRIKLNARKIIRLETSIAPIISIPFLAFIWIQNPAPHAYTAGI
jgi:hypothetical protein